MIIKASERARLLREKDAYMQKYAEQKSQYDTQTAQFKKESNEYVYKVADELKALIQDDLNKIPGANLEVRNDSYGRDNCKYYIYLYYRSDKQDNSRYERSTKSNYNRYTGLSWSYYIYLYYDYETGHVSLRKEPTLSAQILEVDDFEILKSTYDLFSKLETIDWDTIIRRVNNEVPKVDNYVTTPNPGSMNTKPWDEKIDIYDITRIIGKDVWVKVRIDREESYDRWSSYSNAQGVDGIGWIKVSSQTEKFYLFNWLSQGDRYGNDDNYKQNVVSRALRVQYKLKKIYFKVERPVQYMTTDELTEEIYPEDGQS